MDVNRFTTESNAHVLSNNYQSEISSCIVHIDQFKICIVLFEWKIITYQLAEVDFVFQILYFTCELLNMLLCRVVFFQIFLLQCIGDIFG